MNILAISFGRKMSNCDIMAKQALLECQRQGHEIHFLRADDLDIKSCTGCIACVIGMIAGFGQGKCVIKDEFPILDEAIMNCDALLLVCPTYEMGPTGRFRTICDRIGPSHDVSFRKTAIEEGLAAGKPAETLPDARSLKSRVGALVSVGGAMTKNWLAFTLPTMFALPMSLGIDVIDSYEYFGAMAYENVVGNTPVMERMTAVGQHLCEALAAQSESERTRWRGEDLGICPVCHNRLLTMLNEEGTIECPTCGIEGQLLCTDGKFHAHFTREQLSRSRMFYAGKLEHSTEIKTCAAPRGSIPNLKERLAPYLHVGE